MRSFKTKVIVSLIGSAVFAISLSSNLIAQKTSDETTAISYTVDLTDSKNHYVTVTANVPVESETTELMMAVWTPGSYLVREYARHINSMEVTSGGKALKFEKTRKNRWTVQSKGVKSFVLKYRVYCNEMSVRTNWVGSEYAMLNGAPTYITLPDRLDRPHTVRLKLPRAWTRSATSLRSTGDTPHTFKAKNFDELVDSPIVAGNVSVYPFTVGGIEHQLVNVGESGQWDGTKAATDLKKIVQAHHDMWETIPYDRYLFLNMIVESGGGLEHDNSSVLMTSRWSFRESGRYKGWLSLASHEFFHTWNVRRLRPKSLVKYDYENEVYTDGLWIAEGITSYYEELALVRAGILSRNEFLSKVSGNVESVQRTEGRKVQSLKDASYDAWIKFYRPDENSSNTTISYYSKGAVVAFLLDAKIRKLTKGKKSLDDLLRKMFADYAESGFTTNDFRNAASEIAGEDLSDWFASAIDSTDELDYSDIESLGIMVPNKKVEPAPSPKTSTPPKNDESAKSERAKKADQENEKQADSTAGKATGKKRKKKRSRKQKVEDARAKVAEKMKQAAAKKASEETDSKAAKSDKVKVEKADPADSKKKPADKPTTSVVEAAKRLFTSASARQAPARATSKRPWLGFRSSSSDGKVTVSSVSPDSPATEVGLNIDDEIIALDGYRVTSSVESRLSQYEVGDEVELLIARRGKLMTLKPTIGTRETESWRLRFVPKPSDDQKQQLDLWLGSGKK